MPIPAAALAMAGGQAAEAAGAATAVAALNLQLKDLTTSCQNATGIIGRFRSVLEETVGLFSPVTLLQFNRAVNDLLAVFGEIFKPVLQTVTSLVRQVADYFYSLPDTFKKIIRQMGEFTAIIGVVTILGGAIASLGAGLAFLSNQAKYVYQLFSGTAGGASALSKIGPLFESVIGGIVQAVQKAWTVTAPFRAQLATAFDALGKSLSELFDVLKPVLALVVELIAAGIVGAIYAWTVGMKIATRIITGLATAVSRLLGPLSQWLSMMGFSLPDMKRPKRDSFGLGFGGATVTDPASLYNRLTEEIARGSRTADPSERTANATEESLTALQNIEGLLRGALQGGAQGVESGVSGVATGAGLGAVGGAAEATPRLLRGILDALTGGLIGGR